MSTSEGAPPAPPGAAGFAPPRPEGTAGAATAEGGGRGVVLFVLILGSLTYSLLQSMLAPALPTIAGELHTSIDLVAWVMTGYMLCAAVTTPILGRLGDMYGKKPLFVASIAALGLGSLVCAVAPDITVMIAGRVVQGFGAAVFPLSYGIIRDEYPPARRPAAIGLISAILGIGGGLGVALTGPIVEHLGFRWLFWLPMGVCAVTVVVAWFLIPDNGVRVPARINWPGAALLSGGLVCLLLGLSRGQAWGWTSGVIVGLFAGSAVLLVAWVAAEVRAAEPLIDMGVMRLRGVWTTNAAALLTGYAMIGSMFLIPQLLQLPESTGIGFGRSVTAAGVCMLPLAVTMLIGGPLAGLLDRRFGSRVSMLAGCALITAGFVLLVAAHAQIWQIITGLSVVGMGVGLAFAAMANLIVAAVPVEQTGVATGINTVARSVGTSFGSTLATVAITSQAVAGVPTEDGYVTAFALCAVAGLAAFAVSLLIPGRATREVTRQA